MTWYEDWFNSENYLKVYSHRDDAEAERLVSLIANKINLKQGSFILDMACGAGRHAIAFAKRGFNVTAVDLSQKLLNEANKNALAAKVKINFVLSDILNFNTSQQFDLVINLFTSIGYFEDDEENFKVVLKGFNLLKPRGYFVLDYFNKEFLIKNLVPTSVLSENGFKIIQERSIAGNRVVKNITIEKEDSIDKFYESVRLYSYEEIKNILIEAGFKIQEEIGDFLGNVYNIETSPRLILFARK
jgi:2-polyprenyl-3-methyl-5-hydroxy-6-metoxy-1,4-benzoquinol methylase